MGKKLNATVDEVEEVRVTLEGQITSTKEKVESLLKAQVATLEDKLKAEVATLKDSIKRIDDIKIEQGSCDQVAEKTAKDLDALGVVIKKDMEAIAPKIEVDIKRTRKDLLSEIDQKGIDVTNSVMTELTTLFELVENDMQQQREKLEEKLMKIGEDIYLAISAQRAELTQDIGYLKDEVAKSTEKIREEAAVNLKSLETSQETALQKQIQKAKVMQIDTDQKFTEVEEKMKKRAEEAGKAVQAAVQKAEEEMVKQQTWFNEKLEQNGADLGGVWAAFNDVQNVPTRKVEWVIKNASSRLKPPKADSEKTFNSWRSPKFDASGARNLQFEFRTYRKTEPPADDQDKGNCVVLLHGPVDSHIAFKISVGQASETLEHFFDGDDDPVCSKRLCFFQEHISKNDTLTIGCEVLECIFQFDKKIPTNEETDGSSAATDEEKAQALETSFRMQRHCNNRVLDMVRTQLDFFKKRMTRRVEWRLEEPMQMRRSFPKGAPMKSKEFDAAGISGLSLHFFPSGYDHASDGFCSFFLQAPQGVTMRCVLQVANEKKEINHTFEKAGYLGKTNFMRFEHAVNRDEDCIDVSIDVLDAHVDLIAKDHHPPPINVGLRNFVKEAMPLVPLGSTVKMTRSAEQLPAILQEVKVLPSLWPTKNRHDPDVKPANVLKPLKHLQKGRPRSGLRRTPSSPVMS